MDPHNFHVHLANLVASAASKNSKPSPFPTQFGPTLPQLDLSHLVAPTSPFQRGRPTMASAVEVQPLSVPFAEPALVIDRNTFAAYTSKVALYEQELFLLHHERVSWMREREGLLEKITQMETSDSHLLPKASLPQNPRDSPSNDEWASSFLRTLASAGQPLSPSKISESALISPQRPALSPSRPQGSNSASAFTPISPPSSASVSAPPTIRVSEAHASPAVSAPSSPNGSTTCLNGRSNVNSKRKRSPRSDDEDSITANENDDDITDDMEEDYMSQNKRTKTSEMSSFSSVGALPNSLSHPSKPDNMTTTHSDMHTTAWQQHSTLMSSQTQAALVHQQSQQNLPRVPTHLSAAPAPQRSASLEFVSGLSKDSGLKDAAQLHHVQPRSGALTPLSLSSIATPRSPDSDMALSPVLIIEGSRRGHLPEFAVRHLKNWFYAHKSHPYPSEDEKTAMVDSTSLSRAQINNWFTNARRRLIPRRDSN